MTARTGPEPFQRESSTDGQPPGVTTTGLDALRELRAQGLLEKEHHRVAGLLADEALGDAGLQRAGRLLAGLDPDAVLGHHPGTPVVSVALTGQSTVDRVLDPLRGELARHGVLLRAAVGDHGTYVRDLAEPERAFGRLADLTLCLLDAETVFSGVRTPWRVADVERAAGEVLERLTALAAGFAGLLVLNTVPLLRRHTHQLVDHGSRAALGVVWREFNASLLRLAADRPSLVVIDLDPLIAQGCPAEEPRMAAYAKEHLAAPLLAAYAREVAHLARSLCGMTRKALVLDLDNTLWDGILAEDGPEGIAAAGTLRGEAYGAFQKVVKQLGSQGVLLAVSSKNDEGPVLEVLRGHPDLVLREPDFVAVSAHWQPKDGSLARIAERVGIGADALVFADDSPAERAQVRRGLPEVAVVALDGEPALHVTRLLRDGWFDTLRLTEEDRARTGQYRTEGERRELRERAGSHEDFLRELRIRVELGPPRAHEFARLAQLTQRTNQFNLTGLRMRPDELAAAQDDRLLLAARSADRFGDNGLVGAVLGRYADDGLHLDNMWLSCRVLARGIEQACVCVLLTHARERGLPAVHARFSPTPRNTRVRDFYPSLGFAETAYDGEAVIFRHDLEPAEIPAVPGHLAVLFPDAARTADGQGVEGGRRHAEPIGVPGVPGVLGCQWHRHGSITAP